MPGLWIPVAVMLAGHSERSPVVLMAVAWSLGWPLAVATHEFGHALTARLNGFEVTGVALGAGRRLWRARWFGFPVEFRRNPFGGGLTYFVDLKHRTSRWPTFWAVLGGPAANAAMATVLLSAAYMSSTLERYGDLDLGVATLSGLGASHVLMAIANLIPWGRGDPSGRFEKDGRQLVSLISRPRPRPEAWPGKLREIHRYLHAGRIAEAEIACHEAAGLKPGSVVALAYLVHCMSHARGPATAAKYYLHHRMEFEAAQETEDEAEKASLSYFHANVAWVALVSEDESMAAPGIAHARAAYQLSPTYPGSKAVYGAVLTAEGNAGEGVRLLLEAVREMTDMLDKADTCALLVKAEQQRGDPRRARTFEDLRRHLIRSAAA